MCGLYNSSIKNIVKENNSLKLAKEFSGYRGQVAISQKVKNLMWRFFSML